MPTIQDAIAAITDASSPAEVASVAARLTAAFSADEVGPEWFFGLMERLAARAGWR